MSHVDLRESLRTLVPPDMRADWEDVRRRAARRRAPVGRLTFVVALVVFVTLAVGSALALSGRLGGLFHGTPVKVTPRERFFLSEFDMQGKVELVARRNGSAFYVIRNKDGRPCYFVGRTRSHLTPAQRQQEIRFGSGGCVDPRTFPSRAVPVLDYSFYSYRRGDAEARLAGLQGFAADPVDHIGVIGRDKKIMFTLKVEHNVYTAGRRGFMGARGIVAFDHDGKILWVQCVAGPHGPAPQFPSGGCGTYKSTPPPTPPRTTVPLRPLEHPGPVVVQHGSADGATVDIRGDRITASFANVSAATRALLVSKTHKVTVGCFKLVTIAGLTDASAAYYSKPFTETVRLRPPGPFGPTFPRAPYDGCTAMGTYGHNWNDGHGTHDTIEIALTPRGRRYFAERAVTRDIGWLARARVFRDIRYATRPFSSATAARRLGARVVSLSGPAETPPLGKLGIWLGRDRRVVLVEPAPTGRRFFFELRKGIAYRTNITQYTRAF